ncbi:MAG: hypothetical protein ACOC3Z_01750 [Nanoarchaeota archaeon]
MNKKKGQTEIINLIAGLIVIAGGVLVIFDYINLGLLLTGLGAVIEAIKLTLQQGVK